MRKQINMLQIKQWERIQEKKNEMKWRQAIYQYRVWVS